MEKNSEEKGEMKKRKKRGRMEREKSFFFQAEDDIRDRDG